MVADEQARIRVVDDEATICFTFSYQEVAMDRTSPHVLIVAAQPTVRFALEELLRAYGYDVTSVSGAAHVQPVAPEASEAVLVASPVPQTDRYGHAPSEPGNILEREHGTGLVWEPN